MHSFDRDARCTLFFCLIQIICLFFVSPTHAAPADSGEPAQAELSDLSLEQLMDIQVATVFGASKYRQKVTEAPSSISIVTAEEIRKFGYRTLADILRSQRGFYVTYDRNYSYVGVRGFGRPSDYNSRLLVLINGHRINDNIYNGVLIGTDAVLDIDLIDHIEIIRGPSSSLYGTSAFFGVINIVTRRGGDLAGAEVSGAAASFGTYGGRLSFGNAPGSGPEILASGSHYDSKGQDLDFEDRGRAADSDYDRAKSLFAAMSYKDFTLTGAYVSRKKGVPTGAYGTVFSNPDTFARDDLGYIDLKYERSFPDIIDVAARLAYDRYTYDADYIYDWSDPGDPPLLVRNKDYARGQWWSAGLQFGKTLHERHKAILGVDYEANIQQDQGNYDEAVYLKDRRSSTNWGVYLQDEFRILSNLILNAGVRHDHYETFGGTTNPRIALIYSPVERTTVKLLYGSAFRAPSVFELYYDDGGIQLAANPRLKPERIKTWEVVIEQYLAKHILVTATGFSYTIHDLISQRQEGDLLIFRNGETVEARGIELEVEAKWQNGVSGRLSYAYQDSKEKRTGRRLSNSPKHMAKMNVIVPLIKEKVFMGTEVQYLSSRMTVAGERLGDFLVANITLFSRNLVKGLDISASVYNLFHRKYRDPSGGEIPGRFVEQDGRSFRVKLTCSF